MVFLSDKLQWVEPSDRAGTVAALKAKAESDGPFEAIAILMGTGPSVRYLSTFDDD